MAKRGRKPLKRPDARLIDESAIPSAWAPPAHITGQADVAWRHVVGLLAAAGNLDRTDPVLVESYAINVAMLREAQQDVAFRGVTVEFGEEEKKRVKANPACAVINSASMRLKAIAEALQLTPSTSKLASDRGTTDQQGAKWAGLLGITG